MDQARSEGREGAEGAATARPGLPRAPGAAAIASVLLVVGLALAAAPVRALDLRLPGGGSATLHGYYKNFVLGLDAADPLLEGGVSDLNRLRLMVEADVARRLDLTVHYEQIAQVHPLLGNGLFVGASGPPGAFGLRWTIRDDSGVLWTHEIDRLSLRYRPDWGDVVVGRQAIGWGVGVIWAPLDLFGAFSPVQIDRELRPGVDAARVVASLGPLTEAEAVYAVSDTPFDQHSAALRWRTTLEAADLDVGAIAGKFFDDAVVGVLAAGQVAGVGLHASVAGTFGFAGGERIGPKRYARAVAGADYRLASGLLVLAEYYFNGWGAPDPAEYLGRLASPRIGRGEIFNLGRHYLGLLADWEAHPLVHLQAQGQWNLADPSAQLGPAFTVSLSDEAQLDGGAFFALGERSRDGVLRSEFGSAPDLYYLAVKLYF